MESGGSPNCGSLLCRDLIIRYSDQGSLKRAHIETLLADKDFCKELFRLFDKEENGFLLQDTWFEMIKANMSYIPTKKGLAAEEKTNFVELLEAIAYLICQDDPLRPETCQKIFSSRGVPSKVLKLADVNGDGVVSVDEMVKFWTVLTTNRLRIDLTPEHLRHLENVFRQHLAKDKEEFTLEEFKKIVPSKNPFFVDRAFRIFDQDGNGTVSMAEFIDTMYKFAGQRSDEKLAFLFKVYDLDDDGLIQQSDLREVMKACMEENGMFFDEKEIEDLAQALYEDAAGLAGNDREEDDEKQGITIEDLKAELKKHDGLLENLSISIGKWLVPPTPPTPRPLSERLRGALPSQFSINYWRNNKNFLVFSFLIFAINLILFVLRAYYFKDFSTLAGNTPNGFYMMSRANGRVLLFNSMIIQVLVLRYTITKLREFGFSSVLPLDNHIYLHKVVAYLIFFQSWFHTIMHFCNFAINVQPEPVRFVQLTTRYWEPFGDKRPGWLNLGYNLPPGCTVSNSTEVCPEGVLDPNLGVDLCQVCPGDSKAWSLYHWLLTMEPGVFGLLPGIANVSGVALIVILTIIVICSLPFVRRGGYFEVFYFSHLLYVAYYVLLILHAPEFWKWIIAPGIIFILELSYRFLNSCLGRGKTHIIAGVILPSRVTSLIIKRPHNFSFTPGDWVFVKIPAIAKSEWHPFTISSAPEQQDWFTLHVRGVGQWTNRLFSYFEEEYRRQSEGLAEARSSIDRIRGTVHRKYTSMKKAFSNYNRHPPLERDPSDFQSIATRYMYDPEKSEQRMRVRAQKLAARESNELAGPVSTKSKTKRSDVASRVSNKSFKYMRRQPSIVQYDLDDLNEALAMASNNNNEDGPSARRQGHQTEGVHFREDLVLTESGQVRRPINDPGKKMTLHKPLEIFIDGPFGAPSSNIFRAEHAVLISTGIGVTPFASILQSIMHRYWLNRRQCPNCTYEWTDNITSIFNLKKVDFFWINRDQKSFEWFVKLLSGLEIEQSEQDGKGGHFLDMHMYITSALQRTDMKAVGLQLALDLLHEKEKRDLVTGLKSRTIAGRPNWNKVFTQIKEQRKGRITVFYCGTPILAKVLRKKCDEFGFQFKKEGF